MNEAMKKSRETLMNNNSYGKGNEGIIEKGRMKKGNNCSSVLGPVDH
jgi:hypothetical protein